MSSEKKPSAHHQDLIQLYKQMHEQGESFLNIPAEQTFPGQSLLPHAERIQGLFKQNEIKTCLDYGSGKGRQYRDEIFVPSTNRTYQGLNEYWSIQVSCFDPAYAPFSTLPAGQFDAVICTDVLEHCSESDIQWILEEIFSKATKLVYANIACYPAAKRLPSGENAHTMIKPHQWWKSTVEDIAAKNPNVVYYFITETKASPHDEPVFDIIHNGPTQLDLSSCGARFAQGKKRPSKLSKLFKRLLSGSRANA